MKYGIYLLFIMILFGIQAGVMNHLAIFGVVPNIIVLAVAVIALEKDNLDFVFFAMSGGLLLDFYSGAYAGSFAFSLLALGFLLQFIVNTILVEEVKWYAVMALAIMFLLGTYSFVWGLNHILFLTHIMPVDTDMRILVQSLVPLAIYNAVFVYVLYIAVTGMRNVVAHFEIKRHRF